jgi:hypothetical protein
VGDSRKIRNRNCDKERKFFILLPPFDIVRSQVRVGVSPHLRTKTDPVPETFCSLVFNTGQWTKSANPVILSAIPRRQNPSESTGLLGLLFNSEDGGDVPSKCRALSEPHGLATMLAVTWQSGVACPPSCDEQKLRAVPIDKCRTHISVHRLAQFTASHMLRALIS